MTKFSVEEVSSIERKLHVELSADEVTGAIEQAYRHINANVCIPGFRKGKAPRRRLEALYKGRAIADAIESIVQSSYEEALDKTPTLFPLTEPKVQLGDFKEGESLSYTATVEVKPAIALASIDGLSLHKHSTEITEAQIDEVIERIRRSFAKETPVEGREMAEAGDLAMVDFIGTIDGEAFEGGSETDAKVELVPGDFLVEGHTDMLVGAKIGETRELHYVFDQENLPPPSECAGKAADFQITLKSLLKRDLPDLNDELAKAADLGTTVDEMRQKLRDDMAARAVNSAERHTRSQLLAGLRERNPIQVPPSMVTRVAHRIFEEIKERMTGQGLPVHDGMRFDNSPLKDDIRARAEQDVRDHLLLDAVADQEKIEVTDADLDAKIQSMADASHLPVELLRGYMLSPDSKPGLVAQLKQDKALALLEAKANLVSEDACSACSHEHHD
ncbi:MAG: trigger factor [Myxococcales bacterium]|jgi:trigger factor|nr:trigger factor [Myxococcales bacterium]